VYKKKYWLPPGKNCGLCGEKNCKNFVRMAVEGKKDYTDCPYFYDPLLSEGPDHDFIMDAEYPEKDILGNPYDFILEPLPGEISARKIVLPFRGDIVEKMKISEGDYVTGRPMGAGCPIPHVLKVIKAENVTGLLYTWVVGPKYSREYECKDVVAYHMIGFEGIAARIKKEPSFGCRSIFLPGFCMMSINHTGIVNMLLQKSYGLHVRIENIILLASKE